MKVIFETICNFLVAPGKSIGGAINNVVYGKTEVETVQLSSNDEYNVKCDKIVKTASDVLIVNHATMWLIQFLLFRYVKPYRKALIGNAEVRDARFASRFSKKKTNEELVNATV